MSGERAPVQPLLSARSLVKTFGPVRAVDRVCLDVYPHEVLGIIGNNEAGKSTCCGGPDRYCRRSL